MKKSIALSLVFAAALGVAACGYKTRGIKLQGKTLEVAQDTHARISPAEVLAKLRPVYEGGVQTGGNSAALVDAAAAADKMGNVADEAGEAAAAMGEAVKDATATSLDKAGDQAKDTAKDTAEKM